MAAAAKDLKKVFGNKLDIVAVISVNKDNKASLEKDGIRCEMPNTIGACVTGWGERTFICMTDKTFKKMAMHGTYWKVDKIAKTDSREAKFKLLRKMMEEPFGNTHGENGISLVQEPEQ